MKNQGRPIGSKVRQNMVEVLYFYKRLHGYELYKIYLDLYPKVSMRLIYYHLKKGVSIGEFSINKTEKKSGKYSWGEMTENVIYELGTNAKPIIDARIKLYMEDKEKNAIEKKK